MTSPDTEGRRGVEEGLLQPSGSWGFLPEDFPEEAVGFRLVRIVQPGDRLRLYEGIRWPDREGMAQFLCQLVLSKDAFANGDYALADVLDADHNIIAEFGIANRDAFRRLQRKLRARVDSTDGDLLEATK
jgi:hypothetical protein